MPHEDSRCQVAATWSKRSAMSSSGRISEVVMIAPALTIGLCGRSFGVSASSLND